MKDLINNKDIGDITVVLEKLSNLLETAIEIQQENRKVALKNYEYFSNTMRGTHTEDATLSEDGILERETNKALSLLLDSSKALEKPIDAITKILSTQMSSSAIKSLGNSGITTPINISDFK